MIEALKPTTTFERILVDILRQRQNGEPLSLTLPVPTEIENRLAALETRLASPPPQAVQPIPFDLVARIEAVEAFALAAAEKVNKIEADYHAARQELDALNAKLAAILADPLAYNLSPANHFHDYVTERVA